MICLLHLETSTKVCSVALSVDGKVVAFENFEGDGYAHSEMLNVLIERVTKRVSITFNQLNAISISGGPGSYTGLRIGVSTAKGLCYALGIPLIAIDSLKCLALWAKLNFPDYKDTFCPLIDARRMEVFNAMFDADMTMIKNISADVIDAEIYKEYGTFLAVGDGAEKLKSIWSERQEIVFSDLVADARGQGEMAYQLFSQNKFVDLAYYEPFYLKDFIAGIKKG